MVFVDKVSRGPWLNFDDFALDTQTISEVLSPSVKVDTSQFPTFPSRKRSLDATIPKRPFVIRTITNPQASVSQATRKSALVPKSETVTSDQGKCFMDYWIKMSDKKVTQPSQTVPEASSIPRSVPGPFKKVTSELST